jgi:hypothetical protein
MRSRIWRKALRNSNKSLIWFVAIFHNTHLFAHVQCMLLQCGSRFSMERIKVAIRIKPEAGEGLKGFVYNNKERDGLSKLELSANGMKNEFTYDHVFGANSSQVEVFQTACVPIINGVLEGYNGTLFAYGQVSLHSLLDLNCSRQAQGRLTR